MNTLKDLIDISLFYGKNKDFVIAGGGNTSYKNDKTIWVKASGTTLADIIEDGFAVLDRVKLKEISMKKYSEVSDKREAEIKTDLFRSSLFPEKNLRPSVETSLHELIRYSYVIHTHPTLVNALLCSVNAKKKVTELFGDDALYVEYTDPGFILFKKVEKELIKYRKEKNKDPHIIFLENHGVFVSANTTAEIKKLYDSIISTIKKNITKQPDIKEIPIDDSITKILPAIRMIMSDNGTVKLAAIRRNTLIDHFAKTQLASHKVSLPFTPDIIVYCKARPIYIDKTSPEEIIKTFNEQYIAYKKRYGYPPKIILIKGYGLIAVEENIRSANIALDVFEDLMKISILSENFGGPHFMTDEEIAFIDNWEVENYRRQISKGVGRNGRVDNKIIIITGAAQGFGEGIAEQLFEEKANIIIADLNDKKGKELAAALNTKGKNNKAVCIKTDVSNEASIRNLISETVKTFGGLDVFISNAGILRAGGLDEMTLETFELMTKVNYTAYFLCAKYASEVLKLQSKFHQKHYTDIIQINSKSGIKGSNKNFAYAGGKFGGIGLTQSFAMELMPYRIKVNSICPGNFFEGPLWADPEKGLFVQYLKAGKVPGARSIADVKKFYENQVPAQRGCHVEDVVKAILYITEQEYETGQAVPVTGGQEMLK
jgi:rhamnose utilization protein RhaD (predicted bifunctional aldolase and dehydrogenase)/NAD(P)-dependent dehydrogenase (short-subunit alcohol dehydrogenase family)